jgi:hypothetical protein
MVAGSLPAPPLAQNLAVRAALTAAMDFGKILDEEPGALNQRFRELKSRVGVAATKPLGRRKGNRPGLPTENVEANWRRSLRVVEFVVVNHWCAGTKRAYRLARTRRPCR